MVCIFEIDAEIWNAFPASIYGATLSEIRRLPLRIGRFLSKMRKASSEKRWLCTYLNSVKWCRFVYGSSGVSFRPFIAAFRSSRAVFVA